MKQQEQFISIQELCRMLSVSEATGRNWLRLGKLVPDGRQQGKPCFSETYVKQFIAQLKETDTRILRNRRNKKFVSGCRLYASYLAESSPNYAAVSRVVERWKEQPLAEEKLREILGACALQLFCQALGKKCDFSEYHHARYREGDMDIGMYGSLIQELLGESLVSAGCDLLEGFALEDVYTLRPGEDVLGFLYLSLKNLGARKAAGAYYTPAYLVKQVLEGMGADRGQAEPRSLKLLDPCCGTGNFLLQLSQTFSGRELYGGDTDPLAVSLARINLALACPELSVDQIRAQIQVRDFLIEPEDEVYDMIVGNPPWGSLREFGQQKFLQKHFLTGKGGEAYDLFLEQSIRKVKQGGQVAFLLPEAVLYVKSHEQIRGMMAGQVQIQSIRYLGDAFDKVQCPAVILQMQKTGTPLDTCGMKVYRDGGGFQIRTSRAVKPECFNFHMPDEEYEILHKIERQEHMVFLKGQAEFALGIVTGNNKKYVQKEKSPENEVLIKGSDLCKYAVRQGGQYLSYKPEQFQQTAQEQYYRAREKLFYRFIGKELIFAYDDRQRLSLNSCNILIPHIEGIELKYILAVLNSRTAQFVYGQKFCSVKVLRSYLEQLPIPMISAAKQQEIALLAEQMITVRESAKDERWKKYYQEADRKIASAYGLTEAEYEKICAWYPYKEY